MQVRSVVEAAHEALDKLHAEAQAKHPDASKPRLATPVGFPYVVPT